MSLLPSSNPLVSLTTLALALPLLLSPSADAERAPVLSVSAPSTAALVGPPWISIEYPVNPYDVSTRSAFLVVHAFHHGTPTGFPVSGTAEGIVNGARRSIALTFSATTRTGAYALSKQWPNDGTWTLVVTVAQGSDDKVSAVVDLGAGGEVASIHVPTRRHDGHTLPAPVAMATIDSSLRERAALRSAAREE